MAVVMFFSPLTFLQLGDELLEMQGDPFLENMPKRTDKISSGLPKLSVAANLSSAHHLTLYLQWFHLYKTLRCS